MKSSDPIDHALAVIASIREDAEGEATLQSRSETDQPAVAVFEDEALALELPEGDEYSKIGPGPMAAIRFKWSIRRADNDEFFVDETIGEKSATIVSGPMSREAAIKMVDDREAEARRRFEDLRNEMAGRSATTNALRSDGED